MNIVFQEKIMIKGILIGLAIIVVAMVILIGYCCIRISGEYSKNEEENN